MVTSWSSGSASVRHQKPQLIARNCLLLLVIGGVLIAGRGNNVYAQARATAAAKTDGASGRVAQESGPRVTFAHPGLAFEPNLGQDPSKARFISYGRGYELRLEPSQASLVFSTHQSGQPQSSADSTAITLQIAGSNANAAMIPDQKLGGTHSYFPGSDAGSWIAKVPQYGRVTYRSVYPGVDVSFYGNAGRLEYDFILQPNADTQPIQLATDNTVDCKIDANGDLRLISHDVTFTLLQPVAYQLSSDGGKREPVSVRYKVARSSSGHAIGFSLGNYDRRRPLVIDPVMIYGLDIQGTPGYSYPPYYYADTNISAMTADAAGNTYVAAAVGDSYASTNVMKFSPAGDLVFNATLGSNSTSIEPTGIAVDAAGDVYLAGDAQVGLPTTPGAFQATSSSEGGAFLTVVKADGSSLLYSTYLGTDNQSEADAIAVDSAGKAYLTGWTDSEDFPTTAGAYEASSPSPETYQSTGFVAKFDPSLSGAASLVYSTYLGGNGTSQGTGIAVNSAGEAYIVTDGGYGFPVTQGAYNFEGPSVTGAYVTELNAAGSNLVYSAYLGPGYPYGIAVDGSGAAYVTGAVGGTNFPVTAGAYQTSYPGGFASKLNSAGSALVYSTFLSGPSGYQSNTVLPRSIAIEPGCASACEVYVAGSTTTTDFPLVNPIQSFAHAAGITTPSENGNIFASGFVVGLGPTGSAVKFSTYLGGAASSTNNYGPTPTVAADSSGNIYFASNIEGDDAPVTLPAVQDPGYGFIAKISPTNAGAAVAIPSQVTFAYGQPVNSTTSTGGTVEVRNMGSTAITLTRPFVFSSPEFTETDNCPASLAGGGACAVSVSFTPAASGLRSATLTIGASGQNSSTVVNVSGIAVNAPYLEPSTTSLVFADQVVATSSAAQVVTLTNVGNESQPIISILTSTPDYKITSNCPAEIAAGASCKVSVVFSPTQIGLRSDDVVVQIPGYTGYVALEGTGVVAAAGDGTLQFSPTALNFGSIVLTQSSSGQAVTLMNTGNAPVSINSMTIATTAGKGSAGDFRLLSSSQSLDCGEAYVGGTDQAYVTPFSLAPQSACTILVGFQPSISGQEAGTLTITDSATGSPHSLALSGTGISSDQPLTISPSTMTFPSQPVGDPSAAQTFTITNPGEDFVAIDRTFTSGDFAIVDGGNCGGTTLYPLASCTVSVLFDPTATGSRTGQLTLTDSLSGTPSVFNLSGTGIQATGGLVLGQSSLAFGSQDEGTTSASIELMVSNPGNSPVTINNVEATSDFAITSQYYYGTPSSCGGVLAGGTLCVIDVVFSPTGPSGAETGTLTIHSTVGNMTVSLTGTSVETAQALHLTPTTINFGSALIASTNGASDSVTIYIENTGGAGVTFPTMPTVTAVSPAPATDFSLYSSSCGSYLPFNTSYSTVPMPPGTSCSFTITFTPSLAATEKATFTLVDSAGTQTIALSGTGVTTLPPISLLPAVLTFDQQAVGTTSPNTYTSEFWLYDNETSPVTINTVSVTAGSADFSLSTTYSSCAGQTLSFQGEQCGVVLSFHPSALGYRTGTLTITDSLGNTLKAALAGYSITAVDDATLSPQTLVLPPVAIQPATVTNNTSTVTLTNNGNISLTVGTLSGTNVSTGDDFPLLVSGAYIPCNGAVLSAGASCSVTVPFKPLALGQRTGTLTFPITYADGTTATLTAKLTGKGLADSGSATLTPASETFPSVVAPLPSGSYPESYSFVLTNTGTVQLTTGTVTGTDLTVTQGSGGDFYESYGCNNTVIAAGSSCTTYVAFQPLTSGLKSGTIQIPVNYSDGTTGTLTSALSGQGLAPVLGLQVSPSGLAFYPEVAGTTDATNVQSVSVINTGNSSVQIKSITVSANFTVASNYCNTPLSASGSCTVSVGFTPASTAAAGTVTGTLTIVDNAPGSPHTVKLTGKVLSTAQELSLSQTSVAFANQAVSTASPAQAVYLTDMDNSYATEYGSPSRIQINSIALGGADPGDFTETQTCGGNLGFTILGRTDCIISVAFAPGASSFGARTATVTITPAQGSPLVITLKGGAYGSPATLSAPQPGAVLTGPSVTFSWSAATGATGYALHLGTTAGANNLYGSGEITTTSATPTSLPTNGETIYATLVTYYGTIQVSNAYKFTAATQAALRNPVTGHSLSSPGQTFSWSAGTGATSYSLWLGTTGTGSKDLYISGLKTTTSATVTALPANGETIYARLITNFNGIARFTDYIYKAASAAAVDMSGGPN